MQKLIDANIGWIDETWDKIEKKLRAVSERSKEKIPYTSENKVHDDWREKRIGRWTNGFWGGLMWLMYEATGDEHFKEIARYNEKELDRALDDIQTLHHDVGFMWNITAGADYRITGSEEAKARVLKASAVLASRYNIVGKFIRAWNNEEYAGYTIIDCMMNIPMLYLASEITKDPRFIYIAQSHADSTLKNHIRPDGSVYHILAYDPTQYDIVQPAQKSQGYDYKDSSWSRGQAWAIYGFVLSYIHSGKKEYLDASKRVAHYFLANLLDDPMPLCDFRAPSEPVYHDSTAAACAACGLIELARCVPEYEKKLYFNGAMRILKCIADDYCDWDESSDAFVLNGCEAYHDGSQNMPIIYGDYYFTEALYKLKGNKVLFW